MSDIYPSSAVAGIGTTKPSSPLDTEIAARENLHDALNKEITLLRDRLAPISNNHKSAEGPTPDPAAPRVEQSPLVERLHEQNGVLGFLIQQLTSIRSHLDI